MNSKEQFKRTINHQQPESLVVDFGGTAVTGIHVLAIEKLRKHYDLEDKPVRVIEPYQMLGEIDNDLAKIIGIDVCGAYGEDNMFGINNQPPLKEFRTFWGQTVLVSKDFNTTIDDKGDLLIYPEGDTSSLASGKMPSSGYFFDAIIRQEPINDESLNPEDNLEEFGLVTEAELNHWKKEVTQAEKSGKAIIANLGGTALGDVALVPGMQLKNPKGIRDIAEWYMSTIMRTDYIKSVFDRQIDIAIENYKRYYEVLGDKIDAVFICGTDFGTQDSTFCSTEQFDDLWMPYYRKINDWIHQNTSWKTFKHSCGAIKNFMPKFIEAGFDIINPVQINAKDMNPFELKKEFGKDIVFWGGGIDTQKTLPYATPQEVNDETKRLIEIFGKDGGFVFNTVHNIQSNVPVENIVAMIDAFDAFK